MKAKREHSFKTQGEMLSALAAFLINLYGDLDRYDVISVTERRFFNLFYMVFSDKIEKSFSGEGALAGKLYSNNGLLLQHSRLARHYLESGKFPRILVADDLMIHGRNIGKFLFQMEQAVAVDIERLKCRSLSEEERHSLHYRLVEAVEIRVFARSRNPILLEDGYAARLKYGYMLYSDQLHGVTELLSRLIDSSLTANTSFVFSACYFPGRWKNSGGDAAKTKLPTLPQIKCDCADWKYIPWQSGGKKLHAYIRPVSDVRGTYLLSTVRFYDKGPNPLLTSFPIFGRIKMAAAFNGIYQELSSILSAEGPCYAPLCDILDDENPYVRQSRGQMIAALLSIADLAEFCSVYRLSVQQILQNSDVSKIAINYGAKTCSAFCQLLASPDLYQKLAAIIRSNLCRYAERLDFETDVTSDLDHGWLLPVFGTLDTSSEQERMRLSHRLQQRMDSDGRQSRHVAADLLAALESDETNRGYKRELASTAALSSDLARIPARHLDQRRVIDYINDKLEQAVYRIGMHSEAHAYNYFDAPFLYRPDNFDNYTPSSKTTDGELGNLGIISFQDYLRLCPGLPASGYGRVAAYLTLIDKGCIASKMQYVPEMDSMYTVCKAGERAMFYLPRRFSVFVPALAMVEKGGPLINLSAREAVLQFISRHLTYSGKCRSIAASLLILKTFASEYIQILGGAGQLFSGWNFPALTTQSRKSYEEAQKAFLAQADDFLNQ